MQDHASVLIEPSDRDRQQSSEVVRVTWVGLIVNVLLAGVKFAAGILGSSQAVVADAVHSLSDTGTDIVILVGVQYWTKPPDDGHPHGHRRIETMIVSGLGLTLGAVAIGIGYNAIATLHEGHSSPPGWIAFGAAVGSVLAKEILYRWTAATGRRLRSSALIANAWHHRTDSLSSVPAALAVLGARIYPDLAFLDHIGALLVSVFILQAAWEIARPALTKLSDAGAPEAERLRMDAIVRDVDRVRDVHAIRTRYIGCNALGVDLHVLVDASLSVREGHDVASAVRNALIDKAPDVIDVVVHIEPYPPEVDARE